MTQDERRQNRAKQTAEVFTPIPLVRQMLAKLPKECWRKNKTFCDPACGNGNMLIVVLWTKLSRGHKSLQALQSVFGVDIMPDNIRECRLRLLKVVSLFDDVTEEHVQTVFQNIVWVNPKVYPGGSLQYDFSFKNKARQSDVDRWMKWIEKDKVLDEVELPVTEESFHAILPDGMVDLFE